MTAKPMSPERLADVRALCEASDAGEWRSHASVDPLVRELLADRDYRAAEAEQLRAELGRVRVCYESRGDERDMWERAAKSAQAEAEQLRSDVARLRETVDRNKGKRSGLRGLLDDAEAERDSLREILRGLADALAERGLLRDDSRGEL
jgi:chromosome segregation ATPase